MPDPFLSAKDIPYSSPGSVSNYYGMTPANIFAPGQFLNKFYADAVKGGITAGGNEGILKTLRSVDYGNNPQQFALLQQYLSTGQVPAGLDPNYAITNYDYAIREQGRQQQTKSSFLGDFVKSLIGPAIGTAIGFGVPVIGPALGGTIGGAFQGGVENGIGGVPLGALKGYGVGAGASSLANFAGFGNAAAPIVNGVSSAAPWTGFRLPPEGLSGWGPLSTTPGPAATWGASSLLTRGATTAANAGASAASGGGSRPGYTDSLINTAPNLVGAGLAYLDSTGYGSGSLVPAAAGIEAQRQAARDSGVSAVNSAFAGQDPYYDKLRSSVFDFQTANLDRDYGNQRRETKFELARRGHLGGSQEIDATADLGRLYNDGRLGAGTIADRAVNNARSADQYARANAISSIYADVDANQAVNDALAQSGLNIQQAGDYARGENLGDVFGNFAYLYQQGAKKNERQRATADYYGGGGVRVPPASTYYGSS